MGPRSHDRGEARAIWPLAANHCDNPPVSTLGRLLPLCLSLGLACDGPPPAPPLEAPAEAPPGAGDAEVRAPAGRRLVVVLVVDQMRSDYLERFAHLYEDGLDRLIDGGAWFQAATIAHAVTMTSPGHATIATGTHPRRHGVIQNDWIERADGAPAYAAADPNATIVGPPGSDVAGLAGVSPASLRAPTLGAWLKAASPASKVVAIAFKDRASVLMAGEGADGAYWYESAIGAWVTSSFFRAALPPWVLDYDASPAVQGAGQAPWERLLPASAYDFVGADAVAAEGDGVQTIFPHPLIKAGDDAKARFYRLGASPVGDAMGLELAARALAAEDLGVDEAGDLLLLSLSGADLVGHSYGPDSHEIVDYYVRLDRALGDLLRELDRRAPGYALVLTADHGGARMPEVARARGNPHPQRVVGELFDREVREAVSRVSKRLGLAEPVAVRDVGEGLWLDSAAAEARGIAPAALRAALADELRRLPFVADAFTYEELAGAGDPARGGRPWLRRYQLGFVPERSPDVQVVPPPGWLVNTRARGTSHGTPYDYDSQVPIIVYGAGIPAGARSEPVHTTDVAPTVAGLLGITPPAEVDGRSLLPLLGGEPN